MKLARRRTAAASADNVGQAEALPGTPGAFEAEALGVCIRTPFPPGEVKWSFQPDGTVWRSKPETRDGWIGARAPSQSVDGIHRNGWGCSVLKIPSHCTATVASDGSISSCCNAAASVRYGKCRYVNYREIMHTRPPGCS